MLVSRRTYVIAGIIILFFVAAQIFQELSYRLWIPATHSIAEEITVRTMPIDKVRSLLVMATILGLIVPYAVITLRYLRSAPLATLLGFTFVTLFIAAEVSHRGVDFFVISQQWSHQFQTAADPVKDVILNRYTLWNEMVQGWYFPLMLAYLLASLCFAFVTSRDRDRWYWLAPFALLLNALRLLGRILASFVGQRWLEGLNGSLYFPFVFVINVMLVIWFFKRKEEEIAA